jgi:ABC-type multidrug transport system ATPase subunit
LKHKLEADGIQLAFGERQILTDIYLSCETGQIIGLLGRNGEGKSSLMQVIFGTLPCQSSVRINNQHLYGAHQYGNAVNYLPQFDFVPPSRKVEDLFKDFELNYRDFEQHFPDRDHVQFEKFKNLSGGEKRLIQTYLITVSNTRFSLLDEPFTHLSPLQSEKICELITTMKSNKGFIVTDHMYRMVAEISDCFYFLSNGRLREVENADELEGYTPRP